MAQLITADEDENNDTKRTINRRSRKSFGIENRTVTDEHWKFLFYFIFTIWITSCYYVRYHHHHRPNFKIYADSSAATKNITKLAPFHLWGKNWLFDSVTCNLSFLDVHYENSGSIVIWANVLFSIFLIKKSMSSMPIINMFYSQMVMACLTFAVITLLYRKFMYSRNSEPALVEPRHEKVCFWLIPEAIFIMIWYIKKIHADSLLQLNNNQIRYFQEFHWLVSVSMMVASFIVPSILTVATWIIVRKLAWDNPLFYVIIGGSCYIGLTFFYFWLMVNSCAVDMEMDYEYINVTKTYLEGFTPALSIVGRYHFGTACYHATLIFPRLETLLVMNEPEFKEEQVTFKERFYAAQFEVHNLTLMSTAVSGTSHSESLRELLRHRLFDIVGPPQLEYFQGFSGIARSFTALSLAINNLTSIWLWIQDLHDIHLSLATWVFYLRVMITFSIAMKVCDAVLDTTLLHVRSIAISYDVDYFIRNLYDHSSYNEERDTENNEAS